MTVECASLGLFILDTFLWEYEDGRTISRQEEVLGGGGVYAILGSRMWLPASKCGIVVDRGNDWEQHNQEELDSFGKEMWYYRQQDRPTTRSLNRYRGDHREFQYLNERTRLEPVDLPESMRTTNFLHCVCSPTRALVIQSQLEPPTFSPSLIYEPIPDRCVPSELDSLRALLPLLGPKGVFSPNHEEAHSFFSIPPSTVKELGKKGIEDVAKKFSEMGAGIVVIRSGELGAFALQVGEEKGGKGEGFWVEAFHREKEKVKDVTGAGNSFMGGLMAGLALDPNNLKRAVQMGSVSASFTIEQFGLPKLSRDESGKEVWNGQDAWDKLKELEDRDRE